MSPTTRTPPAKPYYSAKSKLKLALDLEQVLHTLSEHIPGEAPVIWYWTPGTLAQEIADRLPDPARWQVDIEKADG